MPFPVSATLSCTIDAVCSDHTPVDDDAKQVPFAEAEPGATGLELLLPLTLTLVEYRTTKQRLTVSVADPTPGVVLTLQPLTWGGAPVQLTPVGPGLYSVVVVGVPQPWLITVASSLGASVSSGVTQLRP